ncbi:MAG: hypothetical protein QGH93_10055 [Gammaproteobacteria bacterium]|nr:hypothetical protein [Gammaproteobacteria bacterium]
MVSDTSLISWRLLPQGRRDAAAGAELFDLADYIGLVEPGPLHTP